MNNNESKKRPNGKTRNGLYISKSENRILQKKRLNAKEQTKNATENNI